MPTGDYKFERVTDPADPRRCQGVIPEQGQCINVAVEHSNFCPAHGGNKAHLAHKRKVYHDYLIQRYQARVDQLSGSQNVKSLRGEIGLLRMLIEEQFKNINNDLELIAAIPAISDMISKVERVVNSCNKLEKSVGQTLDRQLLIQFADQVINVITSNIDDHKVIGDIANEIARIAATIGLPEEDQEGVTNGLI